MNTQQRTPATATRIRVNGPDDGEVRGEIALSPDGKRVTVTGDDRVALRRWFQNTRRQSLYADLALPEVLGEMARMMAHSSYMRVERLG